MKPILALNAFDMNATADFGGALGARIKQRAELFGAASVLFYERPLEIVRGEGCWLYDVDGVAYLDAYNNVPSVGHCHPRVVEAASRQLAQLNIHSRYLQQGVVDYAQRLLATLPRDLSNITFTCTGSESNDLALRLANHYTGGTGVIVTEAAYHGNTARVSEVSPSVFKQGGPPPHVRVIPAPDFHRVPAERVADFFAGQVGSAINDLERHGIGFSALLIDSIFSSDGIFADPPGFLAAAIDVVHRANGMFIADEVQPGFARTGTHFWGFQRHGVQPDIVTMGKPMGNGYPIAAVVTRPEILAALCQQVGYFNTFAGSPVAAAAGQAVLDVIENEGLMRNALQVGGYLKQRLTELSTRHSVIGDVRGAGLYIGVEMTRADDGSPQAQLATAIINAMRDRQVLIGAAGRYGDILKLRPPLCFSVAHADRLAAALDDVLTKLTAAP
ncbi:MAG: aspartate aminotransferase family protein [Steroidobacteraceae bacterium]|jgi:4-aminobutyrate aminotransferase-like enzyme